MPTPTRQLADLKLGDDGPLDQWVAARRAAGLSWRLIARDLHTATGIDVTYETLRGWYAAGGRLMYSQHPCPCGRCGAPIASPYWVRGEKVCGDCASEITRTPETKP